MKSTMKVSTAFVFSFLSSTASVGLAQSQCVGLSAKPCKSTNGCEWKKGTCVNVVTAAPVTPSPTSSPVTADPVSDPSAQFDITLVDMGDTPAPERYAVAFEEAKARWETIVR